VSLDGSDGYRQLFNHDPPENILDYIFELVCDETDSRIPVFDD